MARSQHELIILNDAMSEGAVAQPSAVRRVHCVLMATALAVVALLYVLSDKSSGELVPRSTTSQLNSQTLLNVYGKPLHVCSTNGTALTGFTRTGKCAEVNDDVGSHHICIDIASASPNFCQQTKQPDWCTEDMQCATCRGGACSGSIGTMCKPKDWCVCQWAFTSYVGSVGCDHIQEVKCDAVNMQALVAYKSAVAANPNAQADGYPISGALACLKQRCKLL